MVKVVPSKVPFRAVVCLDGNAWPSPEEVERAPAAGTAAAKAADSVAVRRSYPAGSVISGLHLRLYDQGGIELLIGKDSFEVREGVKRVSTIISRPFLFRGMLLLTCILARFM